LTSSRLFIVILIVFAILFIISMGMGFRQNDSTPAASSVNAPGWIASVSQWLSPGLDLKTVQGPCIQATQKVIALAPGSNCTLQITSSTNQYRKAQLKLVSGSSLVLDYQSSTNDPNLSHQQLSWPGKNPQSLVVLEGGGSAGISCGSGAPCQLQVQ
jgi:hypothetical protein